MLSPQHLFYAVLPSTCNGKLTFPLCRARVETLDADECNHDESKFYICLYSTELRKSMEHNHQIFCDLKISGDKL